MQQSKSSTHSFLSDNVPPMGIYETLYAFNEAFGQFMGTEGMHLWSQGFPLTTPLTKIDGPELPASVDATWEDRFYPKPWASRCCARRSSTTTTPITIRTSRPTT